MACWVILEHLCALSSKNNEFCERKQLLVPSFVSVWWLSVLEWMSALPIPCSLTWLDKDLTHVLSQSVAGENVHELFDCHVLRKAVAYQTNHFPSFGDSGGKKIWYKIKSLYTKGEKVKMKNVEGKSNSAYEYKHWRRWRLLLPGMWCRELW